MVLKFINDQMMELAVPYSFWEWTAPIPPTYFVGEYIETGGNSEDGMVEGEVTLSGFTRGEYSDLLEQRDKIYMRFRNGERFAENGAAGVVTFSHSMAVPSDVEGVKRMEIYLSTYEWSE